LTFLLKTSFLTHDSFHALLAHFDADRDRAAEEYELARAQLASLFRYRGCAVPFELADETINRVARKLAEGVVVPRDELLNYFYGVARNVLREYLRKPEMAASPVDDLPPSLHPSEDPEEAERIRDEVDLSEARLRCLEGCLDRLPAETRRLVVSYYEGKEAAKIRNRRQLAEELGVSANSLRIRVHRIREKLEACVSECITYEEQE
jgi:RNA polymerase sigma factor (sigma-70 family)